MALRPNTPATATPGHQVIRDRAQAAPRTTDLDQLRPWDNLVATTDQQWIWLDSPDGDRTWPLRNQLTE